jgi:hypothetical protein
MMSSKVGGFAGAVFPRTGALSEGDTAEEIILNQIRGEEQSLSEVPKSDKQLATKI